jgi:WD40 repeat protein
MSSSEEPRQVDARYVSGLTVGDGNLQVNVSFPGWADGQAGVPGPAFTIPAPTGTEIARDELTQQVAGLVTSGQSTTIGMTTAVRGAGGFGKTTVARMVAQLDQVRRHFADGVLWLTVGEDTRGPELAEKINQLCWRLTGVKPPLTDPMLAGGQLGQALGGKRVLLILDDVWSPAQLAPFLQGGPRAVRLVTTRQRSVLPDTAAAVDVDAMRPEEARQLLLDRVPAVTHRIVTGLLAATGGWPVLLALVNRSARDRIGRGQPAPDALNAILSRLRQEGPTVLDVSDPDQRHRAVAATVDISIGRLEPAERERYLELSVFPEDVDIPMNVLDRYWESGQSWDNASTERLCGRLADLSLVLDFRLDPPRLRLHDVIRSYLRYRVAGQLESLHRKLLDAHRGLIGAGNDATAWWHLPDEEGYLWVWGAHHLHAAGLHDELRTCLRHPDYLGGKLERLGPAALESDLSLLTDEVTTELRTVIRQSAHLLGHMEAPRWLRATLASRLRDRPAVSEVAERLEATVAPPALRPVAPLPDAPHPALSRVLLGDSGGLLDVAIARDASWVATGTGHGAIYLWDPGTGQVLHVLLGHTGAIRALAGSQDSSVLVSCGHDQTVRVWDLLTGRCRQVLSGHADEVTAMAMAMAADGSWLASADSSGTVRLWDLATGAGRHVMRGHTGAVEALVASPGDAWLASASQDGSVRVWDPDSGKCSRVLRGHDGEVTALVAAPDGSWLASASQDRTVRVWDPVSGRRVHALAGHGDRVWALAVSPDGTWLASAGHDGTIRVWDPVAGRARHVLAGSHGTVHALAAAPDGTWLASADDAGTIRIWDMEDGSCRDVLRGHTGLVLAVAAEPRGSWLASGGVDGSVRIWRPVTTGTRQPGSSHVKWVHVLSAAPGRPWAASAGDDGTVRVWDPASGRCRHVLTGHASEVRAFAAAPDGTWLASAGQDAAVRVWDPAGGRLVHVLGAGRLRLRALTAGPDGSWLAAGGEDGLIRIWDPVTGQRLHILHGHEPAERSFGGVLATVTDDRGSWLASSGHDGSIRIWKPADGSCQHLLTGHESAVQALAAAPDGTWLASAGHDHTVRIWNPGTGQCQHRLDGHRGSVRAVVAAPDGSWAASADDTGSIRVWDPVTGDCLHTLNAHTQWVWGLAVGADGLLASAGEDNALYVWDPVAGQCLAGMRVDARLRAAAWAGNFLVAAGAQGPYFLEFIPGRGPARR